MYLSKIFEFLSLVYIFLSPEIPFKAGSNLLVEQLKSVFCCNALYTKYS